MFCQNQILSFLSKALEKGQLTIILPDKKSFTYGTEAEGCQTVTICVYKMNFFVRLALEADLGLAKSYVAGEWEVLNTGPYSNGLTKFLQLLIDNMPNGKTKTKGGLDAAELLTAWAGSLVNSLWHRFAMDNSIVNSRSNVHAVS